MRGLLAGTRYGGRGRVARDGRLRSRECIGRGLRQGLRCDRGGGRRSCRGGCLLAGWAVEDGGIAVLRVAFVKQRECQREGEERRAEDGRGPGEEIGGTTPGHEAAHALAATKAQPSALAALDQHNADQRDGDEDMQD